MDARASRIPRLSTDAISLSVTSGVPVAIKHSLGRRLRGWLVIWMDNYVQFKVQSAAADDTLTLTLVPNATANVRIVLL